MISKRFATINMQQNRDARGKEYEKSKKYKFLVVFPLIDRFQGNFAVW